MVQFFNCCSCFRRTGDNLYSWKWSVYSLGYGWNEIASLFEWTFIYFIWWLKPHDHSWSCYSGLILSLSCDFIKHCSCQYRFSYLPIVYNVTIFPISSLIRVHLLCKFSDGIIWFKGAIRSSRMQGLRNTEVSLIWIPDQKL